MLSFEDKNGLIEEIRDMREVKPMLRQLAEKIEAKGERKKARETAKKMLEKGYALSEISDLTGLPLAEVEKL